MNKKKEGKVCEMDALLGIELLTEATREARKWCN